MHTSFAKLLCAVALAGTALAQSISIVSPKPGTSFKAGETITVELKESAPPSWESVDEVALLIATVSGSFDGSDLGTIGYQGVFEKQSTDSEGNLYATYSITAPNSFDGSASLTVAHFYVSGAYATTKLEYASVGITVSGSIG